MRLYSTSPSPLPPINVSLASKLPPKSSNSKSNITKNTGDDPDSSAFATATGAVIAAANSVDPKYIFGGIVAAVFGYYLYQWFFKPAAIKSTKLKQSDTTNKQENSVDKQSLETDSSQGSPLEHFETMTMSENASQS